MPNRIVWDETGKKFYETGVSNAVLYPQGKKGVAWNGVTSVSEKPSGAEASPLYADNSKYLSLTSAEDFGCTIEAYTYPDEFAECDGTAVIAKGVSAGQQSRKSFGFCYKTLVGNDVRYNDLGYKLHIVYGCMASPSEKSYSTVNESPEAITFSWEVTTTPVPVKDHKPTACLTIDSRKADSEKLKQLEDILYGSNSADARLPLPDEIITLMGEALIVG